MVFEGKTLAGGAYSIGNLPSGSYKVQLSYSTYEVYTENVNVGANSAVAVNYVFVPDILLIVSYNSHSEKVDYLMSLLNQVMLLLKKIMVRNILVM